MTNNINFLTGIKDPYLKPDQPFLTEDRRLKVIHLVLLRSLKIKRALSELQIS
ncbi:hypothetical protein IMAU80824_03068 [Lactiplantibacillus plantarum]|nr:hypothetical protein [Lactiplantibacillus plantarum]